MELKERIISKLKELKVPGLLSCSIIGSFVFRKDLGNIEDIDVYLILEEINPKKYKLIVDEFNRVCRDLSKNNFIFHPEFRAGAFKPEYEKGKKKIQLHVLINTPDMFSRKSAMVSLDWKLNNLLISGKNVSEFLKVDRFSKDELVNGRDGLKYFLDLLKLNTKTYMEWLVKDGKIERVKKEQKLESREDWFEIVQFVVIQGFVNFVRLDEPTFQKNELGILKKAETLPENHFEFLKQIIKMKKEFKESGKLDYNLSETKNKAYSFVEYLIDQFS